MRRLGDILELKDADRALASRAIAGLAFDSRKTAPGDIFFALTGAKDDGLRHVGEAVEKGAAAIVAERWADTPSAAFVQVADARAALAHAAARFYPRQPETIVAVTGTSGKTSVAAFTRQIWSALGQRAASIGTIGVVSPSGETYGSLTTPDPVALHRSIDALAGEGVTHLAIEASSHGLDQFRLDGLHITAGGFTNITRDHLDYHVTFENYLDAKLRLFTDIVCDGGIAVVNADAHYADKFCSAAKERQLKLLTVGETGDTLRLAARHPHGNGQDLCVIYKGSAHDVPLPLAGAFQACNALVAAALALGLGEAEDKVFAALSRLRGAPGRLEKVAYAPSGGPIYVDYAHTPDALETVLLALRPHVRGRLHVIFGCGGDRDKGKRPLMGEAAARYADVVIVTDDNPRSEDAATIRREALAGAPGAREIGDRAQAIHDGIAALQDGDILVIAGKGHETGQIVGHETRPFSDREEAVKAALALGGRSVERAT
jgi:UDP-N-acetylmuramoyl-L-alanyl-D-glutamate--2,6-diaminopimelate ligase